MPIVELDSIPQVSLPFMNEDHREEARLLNAVGEAILAFRGGQGSAAVVLERFVALHAHTRAHFVREEAAMQRTGFAPYPVHKAEHDHILVEMTEEGRRFRDGSNVERLWAYVSQAVPAWFIGHIESMDHVTARFVAALEPGDAARRPGKARRAR
jgi:hemerythrin